MSQMREQDKYPEKQLNKTEVRNLPNTEFKTWVTRIFNKIKERKRVSVRTSTKR